MNTVTKILGVGAAVLTALGAQAGLNIQVGDSLTINGNIDTGLADTGYVNNGLGGAANLNVYAGAFSVLATDNGGGGGSGSATILTFCTDVGAEWIANQNVTYTAKSFIGSSGVNPAWSTDPGAIQNAAYIYNTDFVGKTLTADQAAGVQLAIWKVLYDSTGVGTLDSASTSGGINFAHGQLQASGFGGGITDAIADLTDLVANASKVTPPTSTWLDPSVSDQGLIWTPSTPNNNVAVPEPSTIMAGLLLLLPFGAGVFRVVRKKNA